MASKPIFAGSFIIGWTNETSEEVLLALFNKKK